MLLRKREMVKNSEMAKKKKQNLKKKMFNIS